LSKTEGKTVRGGERANIELIESFLMAAKQKIRKGKSSSFLASSDCSGGSWMKWPED
jgi:hypothetical protein